MKKILTFALLLSLCLLSAAAESALPSEEVEIAVSFESAYVEVPASAIGFLIPADFVQTDPTAEEAAAGVLLRATDAGGAYALRVTCVQNTYEAMLSSLQADESVAAVKDYVINGNHYLTYTKSADGLSVGVVFLGENCDQALAFAFTVPQGVTPGTVPLEIMGSLYEL